MFGFGEETGMRGLANKLGLLYVDTATSQTYLDETGGLADLPLLRP